MSFSLTFSRCEEEGGRIGRGKENFFVGVGEVGGEGVKLFRMGCVEIKDS